MTTLNKRKTITKIVFGYLVALSLMLGIVFFSLTRLNTIEKTVDDLTNKLAVTKALSQSITGKIRQLRFNAERYERFYRQENLDQFNQHILELKDGLEQIGNQVDNAEWLNMIQRIEQATDLYGTQFENISRLIMFQQSLVSTVFIKQELLIENQLSAIRINVGIIQEPNIFFSFGNARNAFQLMRLFQSKYLNESDEKYFVMFKNNYHYASAAFQDLHEALQNIPKTHRIQKSATKANKELQIYYETFLDIHSASRAIRKASRYLDQHELEITKTATSITSMVEDEYQVQNTIMQSLVLRTQVELIVAVAIAISLSIGLIVVVSRKVTAPIFLEMQRKTDELERLAKIDGLTGLANRRFLDERLIQEWQNLKRNKDSFSIIMADVDYFKAYNDHYGHQKGDDCLQQIATTIATCLKRPGDLAGRYGGEEFMVILPDTDTKGAVAVAECIKHTIAQLHIEHKQSEIADHLTLSFGVASGVPCDKRVPEKLVALADEALYRAKRQGRNTITTSI